MEEANIRVAGNILSELSEKIPTNLVAINELIKNAYDAMADNLLIDFLSIYFRASGYMEECINPLYAHPIPIILKN